MNRIVLITVMILLASMACAQEQDTVISGTVVEKETDSPMPGASVMYKGTDGKIKKYTQTDGKGCFLLNVTELKGCCLDVSAMGYAIQSIPLDSISCPVTIYLEHGATLLNEVVVKSESIREQGDTISYTVSAFAQTQDRSIGDVLARMPGVNVDNSGKIQYQGRDINKFYIDGSDILGGKYGVATQGINHYNVGAVEVLEHHQPLQVLAGISYSPNAAINLKLKENSKAKWIINGGLGAGYSSQPEELALTARVYAMAIMPTLKAIATATANNTGDNISIMSNDFFQQEHSTGLRRYVNLSLPGVPNLKKRRTNFNRSAYVSANTLNKAGKGELKVKADYYYNHTLADAAGVTTYFLSDGNSIVSENTTGKEHSNLLSAKIEYELNTRDAFVNNTLGGNVGWNNTRLSVAGSIPNTQYASLPEYYVSNRFRSIKKFNNRHLVTFYSFNEWESLPQTLTVEKNQDADIRQTVRDHAFSSQESMAYSFTLKGITIGIEAGLTGCFRSMRSDLPSLPEEIPGTTVNAVATNSLTIYASPKIEYKLRRVLFTLNTPFNFSRYTFDKAIANRSEFFFSPSLEINWKPNNRIQIYVSGSSGCSPMSTGLIHPGIIMTSYRYFSRGIDDFHTSSSQSLNASFEYKNTGLGLFGNGYVTQSWSHLPYTSSQQLYGNYMVYSYSTAKSDGTWLSTGGRVGKHLNFIRGGVSVKGSYSRSGSRILSQGEEIRSTVNSWSVKGTVTTKPMQWLGLEANLNLSSYSIAMDGKNAPWLSDMVVGALANIIPGKKWEWHISGELYRNEIAEDSFKNVVMLDTRLIYKPSKKIELQASLTNLLDTRAYSYTGYGSLCSFENRWLLRGRELLFSISFR